MGGQIAQIVAVGNKADVLGVLFPLLFRQAKPRRQIADLVLGISPQRQYGVGKLALGETGPVRRLVVKVKL